ncbi:MAG TPA: substrate-binding domain-containing protein [Roseiarcus sp.]|nr:substrate-binding domain-containing protein [Roseiarcus sp.]
MGIRELARHLNISIGTVSRALNGKSDVNPETRARVFEAAARLGYAPTQSGRSLRRGATGMIGMMIPTSDKTALGDTIFMSVVDGLRGFLSARNLDLVLLLCGPEEDAFAYTKRVVERRIVDGLIIADTQRVDPRIDYLIERKIPFVTFGRSTSGGAQPWVDLDFEAMADDAVRRLVDLGHRRIAMARPASEINYGYISAEAFSEAIARRAGGTEGLLMRAETNEAGGYELGKTLLKTSPRPTALILVNVDMAIGLYRRLSEAGVRPGADLAIIGFHYGAHCKFLAPALTCYQTELASLGARLGEALLARMADFAHLFALEVVQDVWPMRPVRGESDSRLATQTAEPSATPAA